MPVSQQLSWVGRRNQEKEEEGFKSLVLRRRGEICMCELNIFLGGWSSKHLIFEGMRILIQHFICVFIISSLEHGLLWGFS